MRNQLIEPHEQINRHGVIPVQCSIPGKRSYSVRGVDFTVDARYRVQKPIGVGAYGLVMSAYDTKASLMVAIKKIGGVFDDLVDAKRILREARLMHTLNHPNILRLVDMEAPESIEEFKDVYMASPLYDKDLGKILAAKIPLSSAHKQYFTYQILSALKHLHRYVTAPFHDKFLCRYNFHIFMVELTHENSLSILHRDIKPANILIQESCDLVICDFGLARYMDEDDPCDQGMTEYVVTRWYRAPELVLTHSYTSSVDLWSVGCILAELLGGEVLFPGRDFKHQVELICSILGKPGEEDLGHVTSGRARKFLAALPEGEGRGLDERFANADAKGVDLMKRLLMFDPEKRLTAEEALRHEYLSEFFDEDEEGTNGKEDVREDVGEGCGKEELKRLVLAEICKYRRNAEVFQRYPDLVPEHLR